jgi:transglutaminase-like putative cysteine protease
MNSAAYRAPNYAYGTSLGSYMRYESLIFMYSQILDYYNRYTSLPVFYGANPWRSLDVPSDLLSYIEPTLNCQSNDLSIMSLAGSLTVGLSSKLEQATSIFNWVRDYIDYSFYYNTLYYGQEGAGALRTLNAGSGNCVDTTHLLIALARAEGIPAKYVHAECTFSSGTYGHVFARLYVNGQWLNADGTSYRNTLGGIANWDTNTWVFKGEYRELPF